MKYFVFAVTFLLVLGSVIYLQLEKKIIKNQANSTPTPSNQIEQSIKFNIYFGNKKNEKEAEECKAMSTVVREIQFTIAKEKEALEELLKGPTEEEKRGGYYTSINDDVELQSLQIENGIVKIDFDEELERAIGGSCKVAFIRSQIERTLKQFPDIKEVVISINGRTDDILQP